jgi:hypothetical protein
MSSWEEVLRDLVQNGYLWLAALLVVYGIFYWLDRRASQDTKSAIAAWVRGLPGLPVPTTEKRSAVSRAVCELFDWIYTGHRTYAPESSAPYWRPLATPRAFWASAIITFVVTYVLTYIIFRIRADVPGLPTAAMSVTFLSGLPVNIFADYLALFVIRRWLAADVTAREALFAAPLAGILLVISFTGLRLVSFAAFNLFVGPCFPFNTGAPCTNIGTDLAGVSYLAKWDHESVRDMSPDIFRLHLPGILAACLVHLWLPTFALCLGALRLSYFVLGSVKAVHEFMGDHPLEAIGVVAALLTGVAVALLVVLAHLLSYSHAVPHF